MSDRELKLAAVLLSASMIASRLLGFVREMVLSALLGATGETDAYNAAFMIPDVINHFLAGGALAVALLPIFARHLVGGDEDRAWRLVHTVIRTASAVLVVAITIAFIVAEPLVRHTMPGFDAAQVELAAHLTRIVLPGPLLFTIGALLNATEQARKRFVATALAPLIYNICIIAGGLLGHGTLGAAGFSWGVLAGAFLGPFCVNIVATRDALRWVRPLPFGDADVRRFFINAAPILFSSSLLFLDEWLVKSHASFLNEGALTWLNNARRLMLLPALVVGQAIGGAAFPFLARMHAAEERDRISATLDQLFRATIALAIVGAVALWVAAGPATHIAFQRGAYSIADADQTALLVRILALSVPAWALYTVALRGLHAAERMWTSALVGAATIPPAWLVFRALTHNLGLEGIAWASVLSLWGAAVAIIAAMSWVYRYSPVGPLTRGALEGVCIAAAGAGAWYAVTASFPDASQTVRFFTAAPAFAVVAVAALVFLPGPAGAAVRRRLKRS